MTHVCKKSTECQEFVMETCGNGGIRIMKTVPSPSFSSVPCAQSPRLARHMPTLTLAEPSDNCDKLLMTSQQHTSFEAYT